MGRIRLLWTLFFALAAVEAQAMPKEIGILDAWVWQVIGAKGKHPRALSVKQTLYAWETQGKAEEFKGRILPFKIYRAAAVDAGDWSRGHNMFYVGVRHRDFRAAGFLDRLAKHVTGIRDAFVPDKTLRRYVVFATDDYEVALMNWASKEAMEKGFQTPAGKAAAADSAGFLDRVLWQSAPLKDLTP